MLCKPINIISSGRLGDNSNLQSSSHGHDEPTSSTFWMSLSSFFFVDMHALLFFDHAPFSLTFFGERVSCLHSFTCGEQFCHH